MCMSRLSDCARLSRQQDHRLGVLGELLQPPKSCGLYCALHHRTHVTEACLCRAKVLPVVCGSASGRTGWRLHVSTRCWSRLQNHKERACRLVGLAVYLPLLRGTQDCVWGGCGFEDQHLGANQLRRAQVKQAGHSPGSAHMPFLFHLPGRASSPELHRRHF